MIMKNDYDRAILYKILQSECLKYKRETNRNMEKTNRNRTASSEPRVTDISVNRGSPIVNAPAMLTRSLKQDPFKKTANDFFTS